MACAPSLGMCVQARPDDCARPHTCGQVKYEKTTAEISVGPDDSAALLQTRIYFATKVLPTRQKLIGFKGVSGALPPVACAAPPFEPARRPAAFSSCMVPVGRRRQWASSMQATARS